MKIQVCKKSSLKKNLIIYLSALLVWGLIGCEFEIPTTPRLPSKWNTKVVIPLLDKTYSISDLIFDASGDTLSISIDSTDTTGILRYHSEEVTTTGITVSESFNIIPQNELLEEINLHEYIQLNDDSTVVPITICCQEQLDKTNMRIRYGILSNNDSPVFNQIEVVASLDTFPNPISIEVVCENFKDSTGVLTGTLDLPIGTDSVVSLIISVCGDTLTGIDTTQYLDSLSFKITINVLDTLKVPIDKLLTIDIYVSSLELDTLYGKVYASGSLPSQTLVNSPSIAEDIEFSLATMDLSIKESLNAFSELILVLVGNKNGIDQVRMESVFPLSGSGIDTVINISEVMSILPDTIKALVKGVLVDNVYVKGQDFEGSLDVQYSINVPLEFTLPYEVTIASANPTDFVIKDSSVRANIIQVQRGAELETTVENRTPFQGNILLLLGNCQYFPFDSTETPYDENYKWNALGDSLFYNDTVHVVIDTLAVLEIPEATFSGDSLIEAGVLEDQISFVDSAAVSHFADTLTHYIMPHFLFLNPDTSNTILRDNQSIRIRSYLNLLLDPAALTHQGVDTSDTL